MEDVINLHGIDLFRAECANLLDSEEKGSSSQLLSACGAWPEAASPSCVRLAGSQMWGYRGG